MKKHTVQQEILLVTNTTLSKRELCEMNATNHKRPLSNTEQMEEACWNGLLNELLPEIMERSGDGKELFLWHIRTTKSLLQITLSESTVSVEKQFSIDPCFFVPFLLLTS
jgi:hypothetical protein